MIKTNDIRKHIPRLKMGKHHIFAGKLNKFLDQQEKVNELLEVYRKRVINRNLPHPSHADEIIYIRKIDELERELND